MNSVFDTLTVTFNKYSDDEAGMCVSRVVNGKIVVLKMELGEQADILYHLLTEQMTKGEVKSQESERVSIKLCNNTDADIIECLKNQENKQEYIKELIREDIVIQKKIKHLKQCKGGDKK